MDKTSIIIPCYFVDESFVWITSTCLASLRYGRPNEVIVVNDGSPYEVDTTKFIHDGTIDGYVDLRQNLGYAAAVNTGLSGAGGDVLIISNNDIVFTPGWLEALLKPLQEGYDISLIKTSDSGWATEEKITDGDKFGSLWAMKRSVYETLGPLDESFGKGYFEDLDYRRRALNGGFKIGKNHAHVVEHIGRATFDVIDPNRELFAVNRDKYIAKWGIVGDDFRGDREYS